jgi:hypothetical protein
MNISYKTFGLFIILALVILGCNNTTTEAYHQQEPAATANQESKTEHKGLVEEVLQTSSYTYLLMNDNGDKVWIAIPKRDVNPGEAYFYKKGLEMPDFKSKELDRTFDKVYFVEGISKSPNQTKTPAAMQQKQPEGKKDPSRGIVADITHAEDEVSLAQIFEDPDSYANKTIKVRGTVVKVNEQIMGKNWIHIQDGTEFDGEFDLTITTTEPVKLGSVVGFKGTIMLDKDFGYGYKYDIIMEDAGVESTVSL